MGATIVPGSLVLLVGPTGAGKSTWVDQHIRAGLPSTAIVSSDATREQLFDTDEVQDLPEVVFGLVHKVVEVRLGRGLTTVVDATNLNPSDRAPLLAIAKAAGAPTVAIRFPVPLETLELHNAGRPQPRPVHVLAKHTERMKSSGGVKVLAREFDLVVAYDQPVVFAPYGKDAAQVSGPFAVIGDVHGCADRLSDLLDKVDAEHPDATVVFVGDLGDRGPNSPGAYRIAGQRIREHGALMVRSNHGDALVRKAGKLLDAGMDAGQIAAALTDKADRADEAGKPQPGTRMAADTLTQFAQLADGTEQLSRAIALERRCSHQLLLDGGKVLVVHGGVTPETFGRDSGPAIQTALYGTPRGTDPVSGLPADRDSWVGGWCAAREADPALPLVVYGHIAYDAPQVTDHTVGVDTGAGKDADAPVTAVVIDDGVPVAFLQA